jgi:hypothetical protein
MVVSRFVAKRVDPEGIADVLSQTRDLLVDPEIVLPVDGENVDQGAGNLSGVP